MVFKGWVFWCLTEVEDGSLGGRIFRIDGVLVGFDGGYSGR